MLYGASPWTWGVNAYLETEKNLTRDKHWRTLHGVFSFGVWGRWTCCHDSGILNFGGRLLLLTAWTFLIVSFSFTGDSQKRSELHCVTRRMSYRRLLYTGVIFGLSYFRPITGPVLNSSRHSCVKMEIIWNIWICPVLEVRWQLVQKGTEIKRWRICSSINNQPIVFICCTSNILWYAKIHIHNFTSYFLTNPILIIKLYWQAELGLTFSHFQSMKI